MKEIAKMANVSATTVSKVLNHRDMGISEATKEKIFSIAAEYNYAPNLMAKGLRGNRTNTLGIILPDITNPFFAMIARGIEDAAQAKGFGVVFCDTDDKPDREQSSMAYLTSRMIDGIVLAHTQNSTNTECFPTDTPMVIIDRLSDSENTGASHIGKVYTDTLHAIYVMTTLLIDAGCKNLAFISIKPCSSLDRYYGFEKALKAHDLPVQEELIFWGDFKPSTGSRGVEYLVENELHFDGIICGNDLIAIGVCEALRKYGIDIPGQVKVTGLDDIMIARHITPPLTTIRQHAYEMGRSAADMLIEHIINQAPLSELKFDFEVVSRSTV